MAMLVSARSGQEMNFKDTLRFVVRLGLWCVLIVWPSYLLEIAIVGAFKQRVTYPFTVALDVGISRLPIVVLVSAGYGVVLSGMMRVLPSFRAQAVGVVAIAALIQFWMREAGSLVLEARPVPILFGFLSLVAVTLFEVLTARTESDANRQPQH
jgi:hypothetical protein